MGFFFSVLQVIILLEQQPLWFVNMHFSKCKFQFVFLCFSFKSKVHLYEVHKTNQCCVQTLMILVSLSKLSQGHLIVTEVVKKTLNCLEMVLWHFPLVKILYVFISLRCHDYPVYYIFNGCHCILLIA